VFAQDTAVGFSVYIVQVNIRPPTVRGGVPTVTVDPHPFGDSPHNRIAAIGSEAVLYWYEFVTNQTPRAMEANKELEAAISADPKSHPLVLKVKLSLAYAIKWDNGQHAVGGPIDILELKHGKGYCWAFAKDECRNQKQCAH
jgi:hypothetical protein